MPNLNGSGELPLIFPVGLPARYTLTQDSSVGGYSIESFIYSH